MAVVTAIGVNLLELIPAESEEGWSQFSKSLKEPGLPRVKLVISNAHAGLKSAHDEDTQYVEKRVAAVVTLEDMGRNV